MLPQLTQLPNEHSVKALRWNLRLPRKGKLREVLEHHPGLVTCPHRAWQWRTHFSMYLGVDQKVLLGAHVSPLSHILPVGSKGLFLNLACKGDVKFLYRTDTLTRAYTGVAAPCCLYCNPLSTQFVHLPHAPRIFTFHQRPLHKITQSGDKIYQTNGLKLMWYS